MDIIEKEGKSKKIAEFRVGDTLKVYVRVKEGDKTRTQVFEGICISKKGRGINASFTVLKESYGDKVEKVFPVYSPVLEKVVVSHKGKARRAKLYYLKHR
ncbi:MAG: 50S ribosomal protein L19 [Candidatus Omnitrophica bacterium]|nr:50S ribosomal protein L19 [Candidatus Omnitrophota bacterium]